MSKENITNEDLVKIMKDMLKWLKFFGFEKLKKILDENFNEEYVEVINNLLKKLTKDGLINSDFQNGEFHYFYK